MVHDLSAQFRSLHDALLVHAKADQAHTAVIFAGLFGNHAFLHGYSCAWSEECIKY